MFASFFKETDGRFLLFFDTLCHAVGFVIQHVLARQRRLRAGIAAGITAVGLLVACLYVVVPHDVENVVNAAFYVVLQDRGCHPET